MLIDSHCHLPKDTKQTKEILDRAHASGVSHVIAIGTDLEENEHTLKHSAMFESVYCAAGIYPNSERNESPHTIIAKLKNQIVSTEFRPKLVAIGECGIDITNWENQRPVHEQKELFANQVELAISLDLPIVLHNRNGNKEVIDVLTAYKGKVRGIAHCFDGYWDLAKQLLDLNLFISFSGFITFTRKNYLLDTVREIPEDRFLVETDSPYILPKGLSEEKNEPKNVKIVAEKVAEIKGWTTERAIQSATKNTLSLIKK